MGPVTYLVRSCTESCSSESLESSESPSPALAISLCIVINVSVERSASPRQHLQFLYTGRLTTSYDVGADGNYVDQADSLPDGQQRSSNPV